MKFLKIDKQNLNMMSSSYLSFLSWLIPSLFTLIIPAIVINNIGILGYGKYSVLLSIATLFTIADLSLDAYLIPKISKKIKAIDQLILNTLGVFLVIALIIFLCSILVLLIVEKNNYLGLQGISTTLIILFSIYSSTQLLITASYIIFSGSHKLNNFNKRVLLTNLFYILIIYLLAYIDYLNIEMLIFSKIIANIIICSNIFVIIIQVKLKNIIWIIDIKILKFIKFGLIGKLLSYLTFNFDKIILALYLTLSQVGLVAYPMQIGLALLMGSSKFCLPLLSNSKDYNIEESDAAFDRYLMRYIDIVTLYTGLFTTVLVIWISFFFTYIYKNQSDLDNLDIIFQTIIIGFWMISWSSLLANILPAINKMNLNVFSSTCRAFIIISSTILLIDKLGLIAVGLCIILGGIWDIGFLIWFLKKNSYSASLKRAIQNLSIVFGILCISLLVKNYSSIYFLFILTLFIMVYVSIRFIKSLRSI